MRWLLLVSVLATACSNVGHVYHAPGYQPLDATAVKRIVVGAWAPKAEAAPVIARVAADFVRLRKNYLVVESVGFTRGWEESCKENVQGVLAVRALESKQEKNEVTLRVATELYRCQDGALLWRAEADGEADADDENLKATVENYANTFGDVAKTYAAPAFVVLQDVLNALPNVTLTSAEEDEKIELDSQ